jgi:hypothetical protein
MNFSAQGYALLNEKLAPDIAVLEGGYSIEKALPYVNVGIILAMAGLDYSQVREPDYDAVQIRQSQEVTRLIENEVKNLMTLWKKKKNLKKQITGSAAYIRREKNIYYDTDDITERQVETVRVCNDCGGLVMIESAADTGKKIYAVILPNSCCPICRESGESFFSRVNGSQYSHIYFQDRQRDVFIVK